MNDQLDILDYEQPTTAVIAKRPVFVLVLSILSFIGTAYTIIIAISTYYVTIGMSKLYSAIQAGLSGNDSIFAYLANMVRYAEVLLASSLVCALVEIVGVILMLKMRRIGFYMYVFSVVAPTVISLALVGSLGDWLSYFSYAVTAAFIFMYGVNYKLMR